jgi:ribonuclease T2
MMAPATCFGKVRATYSTLKIPAAYQNPGNALRVPAAQIKQEFEDANAGVSANDLAVLCSGKFLQEMRVCFDKTLHPRNCGPT